MNNENFHPVLTEPPIAHALHHWEPETGLLRYEYNGIDVLEVRVPAGTDLGFRHGSDGSMQSVQYFQQVYLSCEPSCTAEITVRLHPDARNLRPARARAEQAILGTQPGLTGFGVNGLYDPEWDLLIDWNGRPWRWLDRALRPDGTGFATVRFSAELSMSALFVNLRPWYYARHLGYETFRPWLRRPNPAAAAGWCSWEAYRRNVDQEKLERVADFLAKELKPYGLSYLQLDDGYQAMPLPVNGKGSMAEGWMTCDAEKFPNGHEGIVSAIRARGLTPAVWVNANITNPEFPKAHPDAVLCRDGVPLKGEWIDYLYRCDEKTLAEQVEPIFAALREKGYRYIKIDAIRHLLFDGLHECVRLGLMTNEDASRRFRAFMQATRRGMGEELYYLASWGEMHEVVGVADACRISMDANPTWAGVRMQLFESARWFHTHRVLFTNDPDHVCVRTRPEWAKSVLSLVSLSGEVYMLSDSLEAYTPEKLEILRKTLPPLTTAAGEAGPLNVEYPAYTWTKLHGFAVQSHETPVEAENVSESEARNIAGWAADRDALHPFSTLWSFAMAHHGLRWRVMLRVATTPLRAGRITAEALALDPEKTYVAFDFWAQRYLGEVTESFDVPALELGCCQAVAFYEKPETPTLIASSRHVSMDAVSVLRHESEGRALHLTLAGVPGTRERYFVYLPELRDPRVTGAEVISHTGALLTLEVAFSSETVEVTVA